MEKDSRIDDYINKSNDFSQPLLRHLRKLIHISCPEVVETMKWNTPHFEYQGKLLCSFNAFKKHCSFGFWLGKHLKDDLKILTVIGNTSMAGINKITSIEDLPSDSDLIRYIKNAMNLKEAPETKKNKPKVKAVLEIPEILAKELLKNAAAKNTFDNFSYSNKKEYILWITGAKTEKTRNSRLATTIEWLSEGKVKNWKYIKK